MWVFTAPEGILNLKNFEVKMKKEGFRLRVCEMRADLCRKNIEKPSLFHGFIKFHIFPKNCQPCSGHGFLKTETLFCIAGTWWEPSPSGTRRSSPPSRTTRICPAPRLMSPGMCFIKIVFPLGQCCGSMTFWCGSGSADPWLWLMDPDPAIFVIDLQDANQKLIYKKKFSADYFLKVQLHYFSKIKSKRNHKTVGIKVFLTIFAW